MYVARSLTDAERRYSTIEKELLAVIFALHRCHFYTFGRPVTIMTDHRSLLGLVSSDLDSMTPRLRRFVERTFPYALTWTFVPGKDNFIPDYLSRMTPVTPNSSDISDALTFSAADSRFTQLLLGGGAFYEELATASFVDPLFEYLRARVVRGWPRRCPSHIPGIASYWPIRHQLRVSGPFLLLQDNRVCVPQTQVQPALSILHRGHPGVVGMRAKARRVLYWPGWSKMVHEFVMGCVPCSAAAAAPPRSQYFYDAPPEFPGDHIAADHFDFARETYLVVVDTFSGFPFLYPCVSPSAQSVLTAVQAVFLQTGLPRVFQSDGGSAFMSAQFQAFLTSCATKHRCSTPQNPQSNGAAERAVQTLKSLRAKCASPADLFAMLLELQNTPRDATGFTPAEIFFGRTQRTWSHPCPRPVVSNWADIHARLCLRQREAQRHAPRSLAVKFYPPGTVANLRDFFGKSVPVQILGPGAAPRAYRVKLPSGVVTERNMFFLSPLPRQPNLSPMIRLPRTTTRSEDFITGRQRTSDTSSPPEEHAPSPSPLPPPDLVNPPSPARPPPVPSPPRRAAACDPAALDAERGRSDVRVKRPVKLTYKAQMSMSQGQYNATGVYRDRVCPTPNPQPPDPVAPRLESLPPSPTTTSPTTHP